MLALGARVVPLADLRKETNLTDGTFDRALKELHKSDYIGRTNGQGARVWVLDDVLVPTSANEAEVLR